MCIHTDTNSDTLTHTPTHIIACEARRVDNNRINDNRESSVAAVCLQMVTRRIARLTGGQLGQPIETVDESEIIWQSMEHRDWLR